MEKFTNGMDVAGIAEEETEDLTMMQNIEGIRNLSHTEEPVLRK